MAIHVEHELHRRRQGRNAGLGLVLVSLVAIVFGLTVVKVLNLTDIREMESFDHAPNPALARAAEDAEGTLP